MSLLASRIDVYVAVVATVGVIIGGVAAYFGYVGWRSHRRRPNLSLELVHNTVRSDQNQNAPVRDVFWEFTLDNAGDAPANSWKLKVEPASGHRRWMGGVEKRGYHEREWYVNNVRQVILEWSQPGDADTIPPNEPQVIPCRAQLSENDTMDCHYTLTADGMKAKKGTLAIRHVGDQPIVEIR